MASGSAEGRWKQPPRPIQIPTGRTAPPKKAYDNPYGNRMRNTLDLPRGNISGNHTAQRTVLSPGRGTRTSAQGYRTTAENKRQKLNNPTTSQYFANGGAGTGRGKGKGKAVARDEPEVIPDSEEDRGVPVVRERPGKESTPDPIDCFAEDEPRSKSPRRSPHAFERASPKPQERLPSDGSFTSRLKAKIKDTGQSDVVDVDALSSEDEIQSARWTDDDVPEQPENKTATPNGRQYIPSGNVKQKITMYERKGPPSPPRPPKPLTDKVPTIDLRQTQASSVKAGMKPRGAKSIPSLAQFNVHSRREPLDAAATAPSGFKDPAPSIPLSLPLEAFSVGCQIKENREEVDPVAWVRVQKKPGGYVLGITHEHNSKQNNLEFRLDRDFDSFKYTEPSSATPEASAVIQFQTTRAVEKPRRSSEFEAGSKRPIGLITLKFYMRHANFNGPAYPDLIGILEKQITKSEKLRGVASAGCWESVELAVKHKEQELQRNGSRPSRTNAAAARSPPHSAGPSNGSSTTVVRSEQDTSVSALRNRTYATERMVTRRAARETRQSETPENLDELVLVYPPSGTGAVNITRGDLKRLDNGQYLNDTLIEFGLKLWLHKLRESQPELAEQVHVFNSFFFKKLNGKKEIQDTYSSVRKWTSKVDIFKKKYIIVPINENFHWYLAIIVNPENMLHPPPLQLRGSAPQTRKRKREMEQPATPTEAAAEDGPSESRSDTAPSESIPDVMAVDHESEGEEVEKMLRFTQSCNIAEPAAVEKKPEDRSRSTTGDVIDLDGAELQYPASEEPMDIDPVPGTEKESKTPDATCEPGREKPSSSEVHSPAEDEVTVAGQPEDKSTDSKDDGESPLSDSGEQKTSAADGDPSEFLNAYVYTFDSLGSRHPRPANKLSKYLQYEAADKKGFQIEDTCIAQYKHAKAPMQKNFCDCGLFVLAFVEAFMKDPIHSVERIQKSQIDWYTGSMENLREVFREQTIALSEAWKKERAEKEGPKDDNADDKAKAKPPVAEVIEDSDDEIIVGEVIPAPKAAPKGGKKGGNSKASRLRG